MPLLRSGMILLLLAGCAREETPATPRARPNVVLFLADDLGYSDLGCYGGEIATPHLDALARGGLRFTQFYDTARCWPSRAALLTGYYAQQVRRDTVPRVLSGSRGIRPAWAPLLPAALRPLGYRSYHSGKWHVDGKPLEGGFEHSYWLEDAGRNFSPRIHFEDDRPLPAVGRDEGYYSATAIADHAIRQLRDHAQRNPSDPFFEYVCFVTPHFPLQAPVADVARYLDRYRGGWDLLRQERGKRLRELGIVTHAPPPAEREVGPPYPFPAALKAFGPDEVDRPLPWKDLSPAQQDFQAVKMAIHAAMVDRIDREIGRVVDQLREMGALQSTLILFLSDNGASAEMMVRDDGHDPKAPPGSAGSHLCLGPGWSTASNTPFRRHKTWVHEGGIATPFIAHWPAGIAARGELRTASAHIVDVLPTVLELAGKPAAPAEPPSPGRSLVPLFGVDGPTAHEELWWLHEGNRAIRVGDWKLVSAKNEGTGAWELYDHKTDRGETNDVSARHPDREAELSSRWTRLWEDIQSHAGRR